MGVHAVSFAPALADQVTAAAVAAFMELIPHDRIRAYPPFTKIEDVPDVLLSRVMNFGLFGAQLTSSRTAWRIPAMVAEQWLLLGYDEVRTNDFARRFGTTRKTVCRALRQLVATARWPP